MANFRVDDYIDISPDEFLEKCSSRELQETYDLLVDNYNIEREGDDCDDGSPRSHSQLLFNKNLRVLRESWLSVTPEDAEIIGVIAKKYGI